MISLDLYLPEQYLTKAINWGHLGASSNFLLDKILKKFPIYFDF